MGKAPKTVTVGDHVLHRDFQAEQGAHTSGEKGWPMWSDALGVCPTQIKDAQKHWHKTYGVVPEWCPTTGRMKLNSRSDRYKKMAIAGQHDLDGGYGDRQKS